MDTESAPVFPEKSPAPHFVQSPTASWFKAFTELSVKYVPVGQFTHDALEVAPVIPVMYFPATQTVQPPALLPEKDPVGQAKQSPELS